MAGIYPDFIIFFFYLQLNKNKSELSGDIRRELLRGTRDATVGNVARGVTEFDVQAHFLFAGQDDSAKNFAFSNQDSLLKIFNCSGHATMHKKKYSKLN